MRTMSIHGAETFIQAYNRDNVLISHWQAVQIVFQLSGAQLRCASQQLRLFEGPSFDQQIYQSF